MTDELKKYIESNEWIFTLEKVSVLTNDGRTFTVIFQMRIGSAERNWSKYKYNTGWFERKNI